MESDDLTPSIPRKRSRSASPASASPAQGIAQASAQTPAPEEAPARPRAPKRVKKEAPTYDTADHVRATAGLAGQNPLNRRNVKKEAKRARKMGRKAGRAGGNGMEVDDESGGLEFTFMAGPDGVVA